MNLMLEAVFSKHRGDINSCDFGPRERLATASSDHDVRIWDYDTKRKCFEEVTRLSPLVHHTYRYNCFFRSKWFKFITKAPENLTGI